MASLTDDEVVKACSEPDPSTKVSLLNMPREEELWSYHHVKICVLPMYVVSVEVKYNFYYFLVFCHFLVECSYKGYLIMDYFFQQTMFRIKDPKASLDFYTRVLGMRLLQKFDFPAMQFSLYFMGFENAEDIPKDNSERTAWTFSRKATLELTHNWGTENDPNFSYHNGNSDPRGFGHIGIVVPDVDKACERFEQLGVGFVKKPNDGKMKGLAFIKDPDGYWIEIFNNKNIATNA